MPQKGTCAQCQTPGKFLVDATGTLCSACNKPAERVYTADDFDLTKRNVGGRDELVASLAYLKLKGVRAMYLSIVTPSSCGHGVLDAKNMPWATSISGIIKEKFMCVEPTVFEGLVIFEGAAMVFTGPGQNPEHLGMLRSPSVSIMDPAKWRKALGAGGSQDWACVLCHEIIHYLHWRWDIIPCDPKYLADYEDEVSGQLPVRGGCKIPGFVIKEDNGLKELRNPPIPFTENKFRGSYGLAPRLGYSSLAAFEK